jgi:hypothetical protein
MKKCRNCGGENSNSEIYCDWCGEYLPNVEKATIFSFISYFFHSFALLGILGAIIFYIANVLNDPKNLEFLNQTLVGFSFINVLQAGLFIGLLFFLVLLGLLILELIKVAKHGITIKILLFLLIYFWIFTFLMFVFIGKNWINFISLVIVGNFVFILYLEIYYYFLKDIDDQKRKASRMATLTFISFIILFLFVFSISFIQNFIAYVSSIPLPYESKPELLSLIFNGAAVGVFVGLLIGAFFSVAINYVDMVWDVKRKTEDLYLKIRGKIKN